MNDSNAGILALLQNQQGIQAGIPTNDGLRMNHEQLALLNSLQQGNQMSNLNSVMNVAVRSAGENVMYPTHFNGVNPFSVPSVQPLMNVGSLSGLGQDNGAIQHALQMQLLLANVANRDNNGLNNHESLNMIAAEEMQIRMRQNRVPNELQLMSELSNHQALIMELERERMQQQQLNIPSEQLMSQFSDIDQLVARQNMINRLTGQLNPVSHVSSTAPDFAYDRSAEANLMIDQHAQLNLASLSNATQGTNVIQNNTFNLTLASGLNPSSTRAQGLQQPLFNDNGFTKPIMKEVLVKKTPSMRKSRKEGARASFSNAVPQMVTSTRKKRIGSQPKTKAKMLTKQSKARKFKLPRSKDFISKAEPMSKPGMKAVSITSTGANASSQETQNDEAKHQEAKMDAAAALLGFKTSS